MMPTTIAIIVWVIHIMDIVAVSDWNVRRLLTAPYLQKPDHNFTTTWVETSMVASTEFHSNTEVIQPTDKSLPHFESTIDDALPIYILISTLGLTQLIAFCVWILYCRKQTKLTDEIRQLSLKMDRLDRLVSHCGSTLPHSPSVHTLTVSSGLPPIQTKLPNALQIRLGPKLASNHRHHSVPTSSPASSNPPMDHTYGYAMQQSYVPTPVPIQPQVSNPQYQSVATRGAKISASSDNDMEMQSHPWDPKTSNLTCLPPTDMGNNNNNNNSTKALFEMTVNKLHPTSIKLAKAINEMNITLERNVACAHSAHTTMTTTTHTHTMDLSEDETIPVVGGSNGINLAVNGNGWSELETRNVLIKGQSGVSMGTVDSGDNVLREMLGLNIKSNSKEIKDADADAEVEISEQDALVQNNEAESCHL